MSVGPEPKRLRLSVMELNDMTKEELLSHWTELETYMDHLETKATNDVQKESSELVSLRESEEKLKQQQAEATRRENVLVMRLTTKEQEMQEYAGQIQELKRSQVPGASQLRSSLLDPAVNLMFERMKKGLDATKAKLEDTQNDLSAWKFTPDSNTGKRLMAKCRLLHVENEELGKIISSGRVAKLEGDLALQRNFSEEMKKSQADVDEFLLELDEDVEGMQSTIYYLQQQLRETKEAMTKLQQEIILLKSSVVEDDQAMKNSINRNVSSSSTTICTEEMEVSAEEVFCKNHDVRTFNALEAEDTAGSVSPRLLAEERTSDMTSFADFEENPNRSRSPSEDCKQRTRTPIEFQQFRTNDAVLCSNYNEVINEDSNKEIAMEVPEGGYTDEQIEDTTVDIISTRDKVNNGDTGLPSPTSDIHDGESDAEDLVIDCRSTENGHLEDDEDGDKQQSRTQSPMTPLGTPPTPPPKESYTPPPPRHRRVDFRKSRNDDDYDEDNDQYDSDSTRDSVVDDGNDEDDMSNNPICMKSKKGKTVNGVSDALATTTDTANNL